MSSAHRKALLTITEFANETGRDRSTINRWMNEGTLEFVDFNGRRYIPLRCLTTLTGEAA